MRRTSGEEDDKERGGLGQFDVVARYMVVIAKLPVKKIPYRGKRSGVNQEGTGAQPHGKRISLEKVFSGLPKSVDHHCPLIQLSFAPKSYHH